MATQKVLFWLKPLQNITHQSFFLAFLKANIFVIQSFPGAII